MIAHGFVFHENSYLRSPWNWLDFIVVLTSVANFQVFTRGSAETSGFKVLRTLRFLRPLRTLQRMPKLKILIQTLFASLPGLFGVVIFLSFTFLLFAIFAIQSFNG